MIKNLIALSITGEHALTSEQLNVALQKAKFTPCTPMQAISVGWGERGEEEDYALKIGNNIVMTYITEKKAIPGPVMKQSIKDEVKAYERANGESPSRSDLKLIKESVLARLLPRAFPKRAETLVWIDIENKTINFDTSTALRMEEALSSLTRNVNGFPAFAHFQTVSSPSTAMSEWLLDEAPARLTVDDKCELVSPTENKPTIKYVRHSLDGGDVREHIKTGKVPVSLAMTFNDRLSFTLNDKMVIKGITALDVIGGELEESGAEGRDELFAAEFLIIADEAGSLLTLLIESMGGVKPE